MRVRTKVVCPTESIHYPKGQVNISGEESWTGNRRYQSEMRASQAAATRSRMLAAATEQFADTGYTGTSLADIAQAAGVSVETVKLGWAKRHLLLDAFSHSFAGSDDIDSLANHGPVAEITAEIDNTRYLAGIVHFVAESNRRRSILWTTLLSAAMLNTLLRTELDGLHRRRTAVHRPRHLSSPVARLSGPVAHRFLVRWEPCLMMAAALERDVDRVSKRSHVAALP